MTDEQGWKEYVKEVLRMRDQFPEIYRRRNRQPSNLLSDQHPLKLLNGYGRNVVNVNVIGVAEV